MQTPLLTHKCGVVSGVSSFTDAPAQSFVDTPTQSFADVPEQSFVDARIESFADTPTQSNECMKLEGPRMHGDEEH